MINFKQKDKQGHFIVGFVLSFSFSFVSPFLGLMVAMFAGWAKEMLDRRDPENHTSDEIDMLATWFGGVAGLILYLILSIVERYT